MLGWASWTKILMLWGFFDESGVHASPANGGALEKLTIGGCVAPFENWEGMAMEWADAIAKMDIPMFHMADFCRVPPVPPFESWTETQRKDRLNVLLNIIGRSKPHCYGFTNTMRPGDNTSLIYEQCARDVLVNLGDGEEIAIVFAYHSEYSRYAEFVNSLLKHGMGKQIRSCTTAYPIDTCPLQMADIVAYEISREEREDEENFLRRRRYPLKQLEKLGCPLTIRASVV
jgi:hypothetical protein